MFYVVLMLENKRPIARIVMTAKNLTVNDIKRNYPTATTAFKKQTMEQAVEKLESMGYVQKYPMDNTLFVV